jgi:uncharacterized tellurite resistance protein B-like protein
LSTGETSKCLYFVKISIEQNARYYYHFYDHLLDPVTQCVILVDMSILRLLMLNANRAGSLSSETDTVRKITKALDRLDPSRAKFIAAFAYLLGRVAGADLDISEEETRAMERIIMEQGGMPEEQAIIVVQMAKTQTLLFGGTENFLVAREFREMSSHQEKLALLDCLFAVAAAQRSVSTVEDNEISQIADEIRIEHRDFIRIRSRYREHLAVLNNSQSA